MFPKIGQSQGQGHYVKYISINRKVLSQGIDVCNIESPITFGSKVMVKVKFFQK